MAAKRWPDSYVVTKVFGTGERERESGWKPREREKEYTYPAIQG